MKNRNGFTLVELLATITILGVLMVVAVPNVVGIVNRNKNKTYIEDGKKLATLAEYKFRSDSTITKPTSSSCVALRMSYLGTGDFESSPNGGKYNVTNSYVIIKLSGSTYKYYVYLVEDIPNSNSKGLYNVDSDSLYNDNAATDYIKSGTSLNSKTANNYCSYVY